MPRRPKQLTLHDARKTRGRGGPREHAGRPRVHSQPVVWHVGRPTVANRFPSHVTVRVRGDVPSLRCKDFVKEFRRSLRKVLARGDFRVAHYSIQRNHVHLMVEANGKQALSCGMKAVSSRIARAANRVFGRTGAVLLGRYHLHVLRSPREVRHVLRYVLLNARKHYKQLHRVAPPVRIDEASSARWFDGWSRPVPRGPSRTRGPDVPEVAAPHTWLLSRGWRGLGLIDPAYVPVSR